MKELKIQVPEGYEIDQENSTFECIRFKPIGKALTYAEVLSKLSQNRDFGEWKATIPAGCCVTQKQVQKLIAINNLMNVAKYLNVKWKPDWSVKENKWYIAIGKDRKLNVH